jgi:hypothetical protein
MTGYVFAMGVCYGCKQVFTFNPVRVPSLTINGTRQPICRNCVERANVMRARLGNPPIVPLPDAYDECEESEL